MEDLRRQWKCGRDLEEVMRGTMYAYEFEFWSIVFLVDFFQVLDSAETWYYMRISGKPFKDIEGNPRTRRMGFEKSAVYGVLVVAIVMVVIFLAIYVVIRAIFSYLDPYWIFRVSPFAEITLIVLLSLAFFTKFKVVIHNFIGIRKFIRKAAQSSIRTTGKV